nr:ketose-bisphosphate aldolase [bacterium]
MALVNPLKIIRQARDEGRAVASFNIHNMETMQAVVSAATKLNTPIIIQGTPGTLRSCGVKTLVAMARAMAQDCPVDLALHADHCGDRELLIECIKEGFTSVMVDAAKLEYADNVRFVQEIGKMAHDAGLCVEGEIGRIGGVEDELTVDAKNALFTVPEEAARYAHDAGVDTLAVAIGTAHGEYKGKPELDFPRLAEIRKVVEVPLVLHGASGVPDEDVRHAMQLGVAKVNIATELKIPFTRALRDFFAADAKETDPRKYFAPAKAAAEAVAMQKINLCNGK